jgi:diamine N-acetyltransferase
LNKVNLQLRKIEPSDLPFLYQWENDATMWADSDTHNPLSRHDLHQYIENTTGDIYRDGQLRLIIEDSQLSTLNSQLSTKIVGCIDLFDFDARNRKAAIGMYIAPDARGRGVGKQAVQLLLDYAFNFLHLRMVYAIISVNNVACSRLYEQMDFLPSSPLRAWTLEGDAILWQKMNTN